MILVRKEDWSDLKEVENLLRQAFKGDAEAVLVNRLRVRPEFEPALSLVAVMDWKLVGHILFFPVSVRDEGGDFSALALAPLAVDPHFQKQGVGSRLVRMGLQEAARLGHSLVIVLGSPDYYGRFGFKPAVPLGIVPPHAEWADAFQVLELTPQALSSVKGQVIYPPEFDAV